MKNHRDPVEGGPNPCLNCPPIANVASMEKIIAVGFGAAEVRKNGETVLDGEHPPNGECVTFADAEALAAAAPEHDWLVVLDGPLHGETYQRQGPKYWVLVERNEGFA